MNKGKKRDCKRITDPELRKERKVMIRIPEHFMPQIKTLFTKYELKGIQYLFDILIVGGIVFRRKEIIQFIRDNKQKYKDLNTQYNLSKLGVVDKIKSPKMYGVNVAMYNADHRAFKDYILEENIKQQWIWEILFVDGFNNEEKCVIDLIERSKALKLSSRKKAIARLSNDEYITALPTQEANRILNQLTTEYDERSFDDSIEQAIESRLQLRAKELAKKEDKELDDGLNKKIMSLRMSRAKQMQDISKPNLDID